MSKVCTKYTPSYTSSPEEKHAPLTPAEKQRAYRERKKEVEAQATAPVVKKSAAEKMRAMRERKVEAGLIRLVVHLEYPYLRVLEAAGKLDKQTLSECVSDIIRAFRNGEDFELLQEMQQYVEGAAICELLGDSPEWQPGDDTAPQLAYVTCEYNPGSLSLDLNAEDHAFLTGQKGMSATTTLEVLINGRMTLPCPENEGVMLDNGYVLTKADTVPSATGQRMPLLYVHPMNLKQGHEEPTFILSTVMAVSRDSVMDYAICSQKYVRRFEAILRATGRLPAASSQGHGHHHGVVTEDTMVDAALTRINYAAANPSEAFKEKVRQNTQAILEAREADEYRPPEAWGDHPPVYERYEN
jgi:hypothetical protein